MSFREAFTAKAEEIHTLAVSKGWYDGEPRTPLEMHMLVVSELAEASEEVRKGTAPAYYDDADGLGHFHTIRNRLDEESGRKPEGELIELADAVIRIMDYAESRGWDLAAAIEIKHRFNQTRPHRHGGKKL